MHVDVKLAPLEEHTILYRKFTVRSKIKGHYVGGGA